MLARLARGGMGEILLAKFEGVAGFHKLIVIKCLHPELVGNKVAEGRFIAEARLCARLSHPNVCQVHELNEFNGELFFTMEYLSGIPLSRIVSQTRRTGRVLSKRVIAGIISQACEGLQAVHDLREADGSSSGVVHRDVSPENLFVAVGGVVKVLDFGIAKQAAQQDLTRAGQVPGKFSYMSPEQTRGQKLDRRTDIYSLGVVLAELLTGRHPFRRDGLAPTIQAVRDGDYALDDSVPERFKQILARALAKDREDRFPTAREFGIALCNAVERSGGAFAQPALAEWMKRDYGEQLRRHDELIASLNKQPESGDTWELTREHRISAAAASAGEPTSGRPKRTDALPIVDQHALEGTDDTPLQLPHTLDYVSSQSVPVSPSPRAPQQRSHSRASLLWAGGVATLFAFGVAIAIPGSPGVAARSAPPIRASTPAAAPKAALVRGPVAIATPERHSIPAQPPTPSDATQTTANAPSALAADTVPAADTAQSDTAEPPLGPASVDSPTRQNADSVPTPAGNSRPRAPVSPAHPAASKAIASEPLAPGLFTIDSNPYARISVDGIDLGTTPLFQHELIPGRHRVIAKAPDGRVKKFSIVIEPGREAARKRLTWEAP